MNQLISVIERKNSLLQTFLKYSLEFINEINTENYNGLPQFESLRNKCLDAILAGENRINEIAKSLSEKDKNPEKVSTLRSLCSKSDEILSEIIRLDAQIIDKLSHEKEQLKDRLIEFNRGEKLVRKFKSSWIPLSGGKLDGSL